MKYYIIAGEASGDLHGSNLVASIRQKDPAAKIRAWGGEKMRRNGANVVKNYHDLAFRMKPQCHILADHSLGLFFCTVNGKDP